MFLNKKIKLILFSVLILGGLFVVLHSALACPGTGIFDYSSAVLDALDFIDMAVLKLLVTVMVASIISSCYVILAAWLLQWSSQLPLYLDAPVVQGGWYFILGLCNLFIILAMVFIALAYILKIESLEVKKTLPKLLIVIVLVNFSMLITGIFVDIAQFFMNTLMSAYGTDFIEMAIMPLRNSISSLITVYSTTIMGFVASAFIPFGSIVSLAIILASFLAGDLLGNMFTTIVLIFLNISLGTTFFVYFVLFIVRIAYLWLLTIFSPLAFLAFVFKQTESWGRKWFTSVMQWAALGVILFFLLGLIMSLFSDAFIERPGNIEIKGAAGLPVLNLPASIYNYLFLLLFLQIAYRTSMALAPAGAQTFAKLVEGQIKSMGGVAGITKKVAERANRRQTEKMQEAGARLGSRIPVVGRSIEANYKQQRAKQVGEEKKKLENLSTEDRRKIIDSRLSTDVQRQAALEINAKEGTLRSGDSRTGDRGDLVHAQRAVRAGSDRSAFEKTRPDWAGDLAQAESKKVLSNQERLDAVRNSVQRRSPEDLRKNVQAEAFNNDYILEAMSARQVQEIGEKGSLNQRENLRNTAIRITPAINNDLISQANSIQPGTPRERIDAIKRRNQEWRQKFANFETYL